MGRRCRVFLCWAAALTAVWVTANLPRDGGALKKWLHWAGFPWTFACWTSGSPVDFDFWALAGDIALGVAVVVTLAGLCAWSRR
jgi:hypothetical protein